MERYEEDLSFAETPVGISACLSLGRHHITNYPFVVVMMRMMMMVPYSATFHTFPAGRCSRVWRQTKKKQSQWSSICGSHFSLFSSLLIITPHLICTFIYLFPSLRLLMTPKINDRITYWLGKKKKEEEAYRVSLLLWLMTVQRRPI